MTDVISSKLNEDEKNAWRTDPRVFHALNKEFGFNLDVAASDENALCKLFYTKEDDALEQDWYMALANDGRVGSVVAWCNPPYGRGLIKQFIEKAIKQKYLGVTTVMLVPNTVEASWLNINQVDEVRFIIGGRLSFIHPIYGTRIQGNTKGSMLLVIHSYTGLPTQTITKYVDRTELLQLGESLMQDNEAGEKAA